jgi:structure-specific recognition protein 1
MFSLILMFVTLAAVGNMLTFMVGSKQAFQVSLPDVAQTQMQRKTDVLLEFHVDDTTGANEVCSGQ